MFMLVASHFDALAVDMGSLLARRSGNANMAILVTAGILVVPVSLMLVRIQTLNVASALIAKKGYRSDLREYFSRSFSCADPEVSQSCRNHSAQAIKQVGKFRFVYSCQRKTSGYAISVLASPTVASAAAMNDLFPNKPFLCAETSLASYTGN